MNADRMITALNPVTAAMERDRVIDVEPNVWMVHPVDADGIDPQ